MTSSCFVRALLVIALFTVSACGGDDAPADDASVDASSTLDASSPRDATTPVDAISPVDAAAIADATTPIDAPTSVDATTPADATSAVDAACVPHTEDGSAIGDDCDADTDCPTGYTCQPFNGIVLTHSCQILCVRDCECPAERTCVTRGDKSGTWTQCGGAPVDR